MIVKLDLDPKLVWRAETAAEREGKTLSQYLSGILREPETVRHGRVPEPVSERTRLEVIRLHGEGFTDTEIALQVGRVREHVARLRRGAGLKPNEGRA